MPRLVEIAHCNKDLNFEPQSLWPTIWPAFAYKDSLLTGFERSSGLAIQLDAELGECLLSVYPKLTLSEIARLKPKLSPYMNQSQFADWLYKMDLRPSEDLTAILDLLPSLPKTFQDWIQTKDLSSRDLSPLLIASRQLSPDLLLNHLNQIAQQFKTSETSNPISKSESVQILELTLELLTRDSSTSDVQRFKTLMRETQESSQQWLSRLRAIRNPVTAARDLNRELKLTQLTRPKGSQVRWVRVGDQAGIELRLWLTSSQATKDTLESLKKMATEAEESIWKVQTL